MANQQLDEYNRINDQMMALISLKNQHRSGSLSQDTARMFFMACYDLDTFREQILDHGLIAEQKLDTSTRERIAGDDLFLLEFGINWIKPALTAG